MKNIFISYSHKDAKWKDLIVKHLKVLEVERTFSFWDDRKIQPGLAWLPEIEKALAEAAAALLLVSADFLNSGFIRRVEAPEIMQRHQQEGLPVIPVILRACAWEKISWLSDLQAFPKDGKALKGFSTHKQETLLTQLAERLDATDMDNATGPVGPGGFGGRGKEKSKTVLFTRLPYRQIDLIGREEELQELAQRLTDSRRVLLVNGLGGIGKTEVCKSFFMNHYREYAYAGWFDWASSLPETLAGAFTWKSPLLGLGDSGVLEERYESIMGFLQRLDAPALLVLDNIETPSDKRLIALTCLPETVKVIANSRADVPGFEGWRLEFLSAELCRDLFYRYYDVEKDDDGVNRIVDRCGRHTLTVELLARTARNAALRVRDLERLLDEKGFNLNQAIKDKVETYWHEVEEHKTFLEHLLTVFDLSGVSAAELSLMVNLAVLPAVYISLEELKDWLGLEDLEAVQSLVVKGWLRRGKGNIYMHPVVQEVTRVKAAPGVKGCERLIVSLTGKLNVEPGENPLDKQGYVVFAATLLGNIVETHEKIANLANNVSLLYKDMGRLEKALEFQLKAMDIYEKALDGNHPLVATSYNNVSLIYKDMGQLEKALEFQLKALDIREKVLAKNHPDLATSYNNVSSIYYTMRQLEKALEFQLKALDIREKVLAKNHPYLAQSYYNISLAYRDMEDIAAALPYAQKDVDIWQALFPGGHPHLNIALKNLAALKAQLGEKGLGGRGQ